MKTFLISLLSILLFPSVSWCDTTCIKLTGVNDLPIERPVLANQIGTSHFIIHWENPTTQSYAENAASYAEYAYEKQCGTNDGCAAATKILRSASDSSFDKLRFSRGICFKVSAKLSSCSLISLLPNVVKPVINLSATEMILSRIPPAIVSGVRLSSIVFVGFILMK